MNQNRKTHSWHKTFGRCKSQWQRKWRYFFCSRAFLSFLLAFCDCVRLVRVDGCGCVWVRKWKVGRLEIGVLHDVVPSTLDPFVEYNHTCTCGKWETVRKQRSEHILSPSGIRKKAKKRWKRSPPKMSSASYEFHLPYEQVSFSHWSQIKGFVWKRQYTVCTNFQGKLIFKHEKSIFNLITSAVL